MGTWKELWGCGVTSPGTWSPSSSYTLTFLLDGQERGGDHLGGLGGLVPAVCHCWDKRGDMWASRGADPAPTAPVPLGASDPQHHFCPLATPCHGQCHPSSVTQAWQNPRVARLGHKRTQRTQLPPQMSDCQPPTCGRGCEGLLRVQGQRGGE